MGPVAEAGASRERKAKRKTINARLGLLRLHFLRWPSSSSLDQPKKSWKPIISNILYTIQTRPGPFPPSARSRSPPPPRAAAARGRARDEGRRPQHLLHKGAVLGDEAVAEALGLLDGRHLGALEAPEVAGLRAGERSGLS